MLFDVGPAFMAVGRCLHVYLNPTWDGRTNPCASLSRSCGAAGREIILARGPRQISRWVITMVDWTIELLGFFYVIPQRCWGM
jgi:hypothetical protein